MSAARKSTVRARGLVLVRGGLKAQDGGGDDDWEDFCRRIGWQTPAQEPGSDFEERIAEGLSAKASELSNVVDLDLAREIRRSLVHELAPWADNEPPISGVHDVDLARLRALVDVGRGLAPFPPAVPGPPIQAPCSSGALWPAGFEEGLTDIGAPGSEEGLTDIGAPGRPGRSEDRFAAGLVPEIEGDRRRGWERAGVAAFALALAAAVLLAVMKLAVFFPASPASTPAASAVIEREAAVPRDRNDAPLAEEVGPVRVAPSPTAKPGPKAPKVPHDAKPVPPGAVVARRAKEEIRETPEIARAPVIETAGATSAAYTLASRAEPWPSDAAPSTPWAAAYRPRKIETSGIAVSDVDSVSPSRSRTSPDVWSNAPVAVDPGAEPAQPASASLTLAGANNRWIGASLPPSPSAFAPANIGVMVQVDLGRALSKL